MVVLDAIRRALIPFLLVIIRPPNFGASGGR
jgi:hypothetical protein